MKPRSALVLVGLLAACTFPDVLTEGLDGATTGAGPSTGASPPTTDASTSTGPSTGEGPGTGGATGGGGSSGQGGGGGATGGGGASTSTGNVGGGGEGGEGGGGAVSSSSTTASTSTATTTGAGGSAPCPPGCEVLCGGGEVCPDGATSEDCDGDGDPNEGDAPDCHPCNDRVHHGQQTYFVDPYVRQQGGMSYDYDCNGSADREYPLDSNGCGSLAACVADRIYALPALPACGAQAQYQNCDDLGLAACTNGSTGMALAGCR